MLSRRDFFRGTAAVALAAALPAPAPADTGLRWVRGKRVAFEPEARAEAGEIWIDTGGEEWRSYLHDGEGWVPLDGDQELVVVRAA